MNDYKPDILSCIANLSNDEVFTPPKVANDVLDLLPQSLFSDPKTTFLDPCCKSGVFLREIAKRLLVGLQDKIPDLQERINHIFHNQLFGLAITDLTGLLSRRSVYCSKNANQKYSVSAFANSQGNILYKRSEHTFKNGKCSLCGASQSEYDRKKILETHAYQFIHSEKVFNDMQFDVIIGNPPYQISTGGSVESQAIPIYNKFVEQALKLKPRYLSMIIPARWFNGGFGLNKFRDQMLNDKRIRIIHDYVNAEDCFPGIEIKGGVCYFLWDRDSTGLCKIFTHKGNSITNSERTLLEEGFKTFIRWNQAISILKKIPKSEKNFSSLVSPRDPFGLNYYENNREIMFKKFTKEQKKNSLLIYSQGWAKDGISYTDKKYVTTRENLLHKYKIYISKAYGASENYPHQILNKPFLGKPNDCCNMTYLTIGEFDNEITANNAISYIKTRFFRFLVGLLKNTQNAYRQVYQFVPMQDFSESWTDEKLYKKYGLNDEEIAFIDSMIRPME